MSKLVEQSANAKSQIEKSVQLAIDSFKNASKMLDTFTNYDNVQSDNENAAEGAKTHIDDIELNLTECQLNLEGSKQALDNSTMKTDEAIKDGKHISMLIEDTVLVMHNFKLNNWQLRAK